MTNNPLPYGYRAYTGKVLHNHAIDTYNRLTAEIQGWIDANRPVPEHLLNERHRHFVISAEINRPC